MKVAFCSLVLLFFVGQAQAQESEIDKYFQSDNIKEQEVLDTWRSYFEHWGMYRLKPSRVKDLRKYAKYAVFWTQYYEDNEGSFGGRLLPYKDNHILVAVIIYRETGIKPNVVGISRGEVGLMQVWGEALDGFSRQVVKNNPELGIRLGIQWLAYSTTRCKLTGKERHIWSKALTQYGAGPKAGSKKRCKVMSFARRRINRTIRHRRQINKRLK